MAPAAVIAKLSLLRRSCLMGSSQLPRVLMHAAYARLGGEAANMIPHMSIRAVGPLGSVFLHDLQHAMISMNRGPLFHAMLTTGISMSGSEYDRIRKVQLKAMLQNHLLGLFAVRSVARHYLPCQPWEMMSDLAAVKNGDMSLIHLAAPKLKTGSHRLGSGVRHIAVGSTELPMCHNCGLHVSDTPEHAMLHCRGQRIALVRNIHMLFLRRFMDAARPGWSALLAGPLGIAVLLQSPNLCSGGPDRREATKLLGTWINAMRAVHVTHSQMPGTAPPPAPPPLPLRHRQRTSL